MSEKSLPKNYTYKVHQEKHELAEEIRNARWGDLMRPIDLARRLGVSVETVRAWERGPTQKNSWRPSKEHLNDLARVFPERAEFFLRQNYAQLVDRNSIEAVGYPTEKESREIAGLDEKLKSLEVQVKERPASFSAELGLLKKIKKTIADLTELVERTAS